MLPARGAVSSPKQAGAFGLTSPQRARRIRTVGRAVAGLPRRSTRPEGYAPVKAEGVKRAAGARMFWTAWGIAAVAVAALGVWLWIDSVSIAGPLRRARTGTPSERRAAVRRLGELGDAGVPALLELALDRTTLPHKDEPFWTAPIPPDWVPRDTLGDLALDALRRAREGPSASRIFEWDVASGGSYDEALEKWRTKELDEAIEWWEGRSARRLKARPAP